MEKRVQTVTENLIELPNDLARFVVVPYVAGECEQCHKLLEEEV
jgi:hypothetical protein